MRLIECYIDNFGKLSDTTFSFDKGLNCIYRENGAGKTTLSAFIMAMLYGLNSDRKHSLDDNTRKKYMPWQGGTYGGSLTFMWQGRLYRVERSFGSKISDDKVRLIDVALGTECYEPSPERLGEELFDITAEGFLRTVFLSEKNITDIKEDSVAAKLSKVIGTDGDVGDITKATNKLNDRTKFYKKTGNKGAIAEVEAEISVIDDKLGDVERKRKEAEEYESQLLSLEAQISELEELRSGASQRYSESLKREGRQNLISEYERKLERLNRERGELQELGKTFKCGIPTDEEIETNQRYYIEASQLRASRQDKESPELIRLTEYFKRATSFDELAEMRSMAERIENIDAGISAIRAKIKLADDTLTDELKGAIPTSLEVERHILALEKKSIAPVVLAALGGIGIIVGVLLGILVSPICYTACAIGAVLFSIGAVGIIMPKGQEKSEAIAFANRLGISGEVGEGLSKLFTRLCEREAAREKDNERISLLESEGEELKNRLCAFLSEYDTEGLGITAAVSLITEKYRSFYALEVAARNNEKERTENDMRLAFLDGKVTEFFERYPVEECDEPFRELRVMAGAYKETERTVKRLEEECHDFKLLHSIDDSELLSDVAATGDGTSLGEVLADYKFKIDELRAMKERLRVNYESAIEVVENEDVYLAEKAELLERLGKYRENYEVLSETVNLLKEASLAITSRYIGSTQERFIKYLGAIASDTEGYTVDTSFELHRYERGTTRDVESYSRGMRDLYTLCLKLALTDAMYGGNAPLIILDDPFTTLDDDKLEGAKRLIRALSENKQIIYFTCSKERAI